MNHYYNDNSNLSTNIQELEYTYFNRRLKFYTDNGVFSKTRVDFGTNVLLNNLFIDPSSVKNIKTVLDIGCGYGIIGLAVATITDATVTLADVNNRALDLVLRNATANKIANIRIVHSNVYEAIDGSFDMIISNPPIRAGKKVVHEIYTEGFNHLNAGGSIWAVIQKKQGAPSLEKKMLEVFGNVEVVAKEKGYYVLKSIKK